MEKNTGYIKKWVSMPNTMYFKQAYNNIHNPTYSLKKKIYKFKLYNNILNFLSKSHNITYQKTECLTVYDVLQDWVLRFGSICCASIILLPNKPAQTRRNS